MAAKSLWHSMTSWMSKADNASDSERESDSNTGQTPEPAAYPDAAPSSGADLARSNPPHEPEGQAPLSPAPIAVFSPGPSGAPSRAASETGPPAADAASRPDESIEINRKIIEVIKTCYDPEIPVNIYELGLIYGIQVNDEGHAHVTMTLTAPNCPAAQSLPNEVKYKVEAMDEIKSANVEIVFDPPWTPNKMSDAAKLTLNIL